MTRKILAILNVITWIVFLGAGLILYELEGVRPLILLYSIFGGVVACLTSWELLEEYEIVNSENFDDDFYTEFDETEE